MLQVKANQPTLYQGIELLLATPGEKCKPVRQCTKPGGRREVRELVASTALNEWAEWPHLAQVVRRITRVTQRDVTTEATHYYITRLPPEKADPKRLLDLSRGHWGLENRLHGVRDVTFDEDRSQVRSGAAPQVMAAPRNLVIGLLRYRGATPIAAALRTHAGHPDRDRALVTSP